jgi:NADH-quinone oxidoreductase subunit M
MGGLWEKAPVMGAFVLIFSMASLGLPGLGNFIAELLILIGAFKTNILMSCLASLGLIAATIYSLRIVQKVFLGNKNTDWEISDLNFREKIVAASLVIVIVMLGLFPKPVFDISKPAMLKTLDSQKVDIPPFPVSVNSEVSGKTLFLFHRNKLRIKD